MVIKDLDKFNELEQLCGNRYLAVQFIIRCTRQLEKKYLGCGLNTSKLIEWVITGESPYTLQEIEKRRLIWQDTNELVEFLCWISDEEVSEEVKKCYKLSLNNHHLTLCCNSKLSEGTRSRVNVLLRMVWFT